MLIDQFRRGVNYLATAEHYIPVIRECVGLANIASGVSQFAVGYLMKCSQNPRYYDVQSKKHIQRGGKALQIGLVQILPMAIAILSAHSLRILIFRPIPLPNTLPNFQLLA